ncbi:MAG: Fur family transcriptional regulator [Methylococcaceae bacterium]|nr:Fur family transcriptional regulator [Methylococcaceae bacterium]
MRTAEHIFQQAGLKSTVSRLEVTAVLAQNNYPLTHQYLLKQLPDSFDRVTLYRVLDWLLQNKVIHRVAGEDRAWRFQLNASNNTQYSKSTVLSKNKTFSQHSHAHFQCGNCGKVFCLDDVHPKLSNAILADFVVDSIELNIKGKCANCQKQSSSPIS